jgi:hypothetical protein
MISCAPTPFIRSCNASARRASSPSIRKRGREFGTTLTDPPGPLGEDARLRMAKTSLGVAASLLSQNGQKPVSLANFLK